MESGCNLMTLFSHTRNICYSAELRKRNDNKIMASNWLQLGMVTARLWWIIENAHLSCETTLCAGGTRKCGYEAHHESRVFRAHWKIRQKAVMDGFIVAKTQQFPHASVSDQYVSVLFSFTERLLPFLAQRFREWFNPSCTRPTFLHAARAAPKRCSRLATAFCSYFQPKVFLLLTMKCSLSENMMPFRQCQKDKEAPFSSEAIDAD